MELIPAIELKGGKSVLRTQAKPEHGALLTDDPIKIAMRWKNEGATRLLLRDLDGERVGMPQNREVVRDIIRRIGLPVTLAGGIRTDEVAQRMLSIGVDQVVLDGSALMIPLIAELFQRLGPKAVVEVSTPAQALEAESRSARVLLLRGIIPVSGLAGLAQMIAKLHVPVIIGDDVPEFGDLVDLQQPRVLGLVLGKMLYQDPQLLADARGLLGPDGAGFQARPA